MSNPINKKMRRYATDPGSELTLVLYPIEWLHQGRAFDVHDQNGGYLGRIFGEVGRREFSASTKPYVWKTPKQREFWKVKLPDDEGRAQGQYESQADAIRYLLHRAEMAAQA